MEEHAIFRQKNDMQKPMGKTDIVIACKKITNTAIANTASIAVQITMRITHTINLISDDLSCAFCSSSVSLIRFLRFPGFFHV